jgi:hypothetical protein
MEIDLEKIKQIEENILTEAVASLVGQSCGRLCLVGIYLNEDRIDPREDLWLAVLAMAYKKIGELEKERRNADAQNKP